MHWCSRHLFSAYHTHHNTCTYTRTCTPMLTVQQLPCQELLYANLRRRSDLLRPWYLESWKHLSVLRQTKNIELTHDDALAEPNILRRACWFNTPDCRAAPAHHHRLTSCICSPHLFVVTERRHRDRDASTHTLSRSGTRDRVEVVHLKCFEETTNWDAHYTTDWSAESTTNGVVDLRVFMNMLPGDHIYVVQRHGVYMSYKIQ